MNALKSTTDVLANVTKACVGQRPPSSKCWKFAISFYLTGLEKPSGNGSGRVSRPFLSSTVI